MNLEVRPKVAAADAPVTESPRRVLPPLPTTRAGMDMFEALRGALGALAANKLRAMLTALGKIPEVKLHVKGALNNGVTVDEIKATLLHATAYCGIPAGLDAFKATHEVLLAEGAIPGKK